MHAVVRPISCSDGGLMDGWLLLLDQPEHVAPVPLMCPARGRWCPVGFDCATTDADVDLVARRLDMTAYWSVNNLLLCVC